MEELKRGLSSMDADSLPDFQLLPYSSEHPGSNAGGELESLSQASDNPITLNVSSSWTYCGPLLTLEENSLPSSFHTWAQATVNGSLLTPLFSFLAYVHEFLAANNLAHYWLTVRATQGSTEFDVPRWHTDDLFFSPLSTTKQKTVSKSSLSKKLRFTTRNYYETQHTRYPDYDALNPFIHPQPTQAQAQPPPKNAQIITPNPNPPRLETLHNTPRPRNPLHKLQKKPRPHNPTHHKSGRPKRKPRPHLPLNPTVQSRQGECVFFRVGEDEGAVHSEPRSHGDRVFVNVVPGDERDLRCLMAKWGMEFPRAWCVGLPLQIEGEEVYRNVGEV
ncbi:hypothetical protein N7533_010160 [Penicillium manginii]|uniref:uncharacterized protein n=1 Tax=Penicillium manginii TaxID=203109 RepID=UPI002547D4DD|nr:uncharacterized protein N7533_010160 [Penicillium manginii]KAJ5743058.1 hypothetical protein N7533_010160 [Penicillium manginii]